MHKFFVSICICKRKGKAKKLAGFIKRNDSTEEKKKININKFVPLRLNCLYPGAHTSATCRLSTCSDDVKFILFLLFRCCCRRRLPLHLRVFDWYFVVAVAKLIRNGEKETENKRKRHTQCEMKTEWKPHFRRWYVRVVPLLSATSCSVSERLPSGSQLYTRLFALDSSRNTSRNEMKYPTFWHTTANTNDHEPQASAAKRPYFIEILGVRHGICEIKLLTHTFFVFVCDVLRVERKGIELRARTAQTACGCIKSNWKWFAEAERDREKENTK